MLDNISILRESNNLQQICIELRSSSERDTGEPHWYSLQETEKISVKGMTHNFEFLL